MGARARFRSRTGKMHVLSLVGFIFSLAEALSGVTAVFSFYHNTFYLARKSFSDSPIFLAIDRVDWQVRVSGIVNTGST